MLERVIREVLLSLGEACRRTFVCPRDQRGIAPAQGFAPAGSTANGIHVPVAVLGRFEIADRPRNRSVTGAASGNP